MDNKEKSLKNLFIFMGIAAAVSALVIAAADYLLEFNPDYGISTDIVEPAWAEMNLLRPVISMNLCAFFIPFYIPGFWLLYRVIAETSRKTAVTLFVMFSYGVIMGSPLLHGVMSINPVLFKSGIEYGVERGVLTALIENNITSAVLPVFIFHYLITWVAAPLILFIYIISGRSVLKRWTAFANPLIFMLAGLGLKVMLPSVGVYLVPGSINKGNAALFLILALYMRAEQKSADVEKTATE